MEQKVQMPCGRADFEEWTLALSRCSLLQPHLWPVQKSSCHLTCLITVIINGLVKREKRRFDEWYSSSWILQALIYNRVQQLFFLFGGTGVELRAWYYLQIRRSLTWATPPVHFALVILEEGSKEVFAWSGLARTMILPISASQVVRITGMSQQGPATTNILYHEPHSKYFRLCESFGLCHNCRAGCTQPQAIGKWTCVGVPIKLYSQDKLCHGL
jgi:hypothetical protein